MRRSSRAAPPRFRRRAGARPDAAMIHLDEAAVDRLLTPAACIAALREGFRAPIETPLRHHHAIDRPDERATLLLMPAWHGAAVRGGGYVGVKVVSVFPENGRRGLGAVQGSYLLLSGETGVPLVLLDGRALTVRRTAAASALAADHLARADAARLLMIGAGAMAPHLIAAHATVRPIAEVEIWNRDGARAEALAAELDRPGRRVRAVTDLAAALSAADVVSAATLSATPLVRGALLKPGAHVDLVGGFTPDMREADDDAVRRASVFVDTRAGAGHEAGDIVQAIASGALPADGIRADLFDLCRGLHRGRASGSEITLFKSVGTALEDLAAAALVYERATAPA